MTAEMIVTENLTKKYESLTAVENLSLRIEKGEIFGLLGPNGAGKSTTVRMLCCLIGKTSGTARIGDLDISNEEDAVKIRKLIGYIPDSPGFYESMSAVKNLEFFASIYRVRDETLKENIEKYLKLLDLWSARDRSISTYSRGMKQKVSIARALIHDPEILIMDEPTASLDPEVSKTIRDLILDLKKDGKTILLNTHNLYEAQRICTRIGVLKTQLIAMDTPANIEKNASQRKTAISVDNIDQKILDAVRARNPKSMEVEGKVISLSFQDPETERPKVVSAIVEAGGSIQFVTETGSSLEDVYLRLVREQ